MYVIITVISRRVVAPSPRHHDLVFVEVALRIDVFPSQSAVVVRLAQWARVGRGAHFGANLGVRADTRPTININHKTNNEGYHIFAGFKC